MILPAMNHCGVEQVVQGGLLTVCADHLQLGKHEAIQAQLMNVDV